MASSTLPPIAVVGMGLRLPGGISTPQEFWQLILNRQDGRCRVPRDRYNVDAFYDEDKKLHPHAVASDHGYFLHHVNYKHFDAAFFSMGRSEIEALDPQQRLLLEVVWECMEGAGQTNWRGSNIGCYVGAFGDDFRDSSLQDVLSANLFVLSGSADFALSNRISYEYNLKGPSVTIRTACSSSLTALHEACQALISGECSGAIVAGSNIIINPTMTLAITRQGVLSPTGTCKTFDAAADGYARGEAINAVYIKLLDDALRAGDPIRAVIRSTAVNCDGRTQGLSCPSAEAHEELMRRAYKICGISDISTPFVECHGTGTQVGDPLEATAVRNVFGSAGPVYIGSVKPNIGHSEGGSGISSLIKCCLALENETIPPNIHFSKPNPKIPFQGGKLIVPTEAIPWGRDKEARISINSFGIGGANAHVVLDSAASFGDASLRRVSGSSSEGNGGESGYWSHGSPAESADENSDPSVKLWPRLIPLSANSVDSLRARVQDTQRYLNSHPASLNAVAHTLGKHRDHMLHRTFAIASGVDEPLEFNPFQKSLTAPDLVFVFTGQGAQYEGMAKDLIKTCSSFRDDIRSMDQALQSLDSPPQWTMEEFLCAEGTGNKMNEAEFSQPLCTAVQVALVSLLATFGIRPSAVTGHSSGELAAAYAAGAVSATDAILTAYHRGLATKLKSRKGGMVAVGMGAEAVRCFLAKGAIVACENSPESVTLSGDEGALEKTVDAIKAGHPTMFARQLRVNMAYHSGHMVDAGQKFIEMLKPRQSKKIDVPFYSALKGKLIPVSSKLWPEYWRDNLVSPVLFNTAVKSILESLQHPAIFLEIGPHSALKGPLRQIFKKYSAQSISYVPSLIRGDNAVTSMLTCVGQLHALGYEHVKFESINPSTPIVTDLPNYPWDHKVEYWKENRILRAWKHKTHRHHELLGSRCLESNDLEPAWRNLLRVSEIPWLKDHQVDKDIIFPGAGYVAMIGEAIRQTSGSDVYTLRNVVIKSALVLPESEETEIMVAKRPLLLTDSANSTWSEFTISSFTGSSWIQHCVAEGKAGEEHQFPEQKTVAPFPRKVSEDAWYRHLNRLGLNFGKRFRGLRDISADTEAPRASATIGDSTEAETKYAAHPITLDHCLQLSAVAMVNGLTRRMRKLKLPSTIGHVCVRPGPPRLVAEATTDAHGGASTGGQVVAVTDSSDVSIMLDKITWVPLDTGHDQSGRNVPLGSRLEWRPSIDFLSAGSLTYRAGPRQEINLLLERYVTLCILHMSHALASLDNHIPDRLASFAGWVRDEQDLVRGQGHPLIPEAQEWASMDAAALASLRSAVGHQLQEMPDHEASARGELCKKISDLEDIRDPGEHFFGDAAFHEDFFALCAHARPGLKVLDLGVESGGATEIILKALTDKQGARLYSQYVCAHTSPDHMSASRNRLQKYPGVEQRMMDISKECGEQGFELDHFDVIVVSNVLHTTHMTADVLRNMRSLLKTGGLLLIQEIVRPIRWRWANYITKFFNHDETFRPFDSWKQGLREAGFSVCDSIVPEDKDPHGINMYIVATAVDTDHRAKEVTFLYHNSKHEFALDMARRLEQRGFDISWANIRDGHVHSHDVVSFVDLEGPYFHDISEAEYEAYMAFVSKFKGHVLWLTRPAQIRCTDPRYGQTIGLARTLRSELSMDFSTVELQNLDATTSDAVISILEKYLGRSQGQGAEQEFAVHEGTVQIGRYHWFPLSQELEYSAKDNGPKHLTIDQVGSLDKLYWLRDDPDSTCIGADEVDLEVKCVGLNFRDVLITMGIIDGPAGNRLGFEASGVVSRVGKNIRHVKAGDRVMTMSFGCFASQLRVHGDLVSRMPEGLGFEDGASIPVIFLTAVYSIIHLGQLSEGQSILIHSACGGVGLAAIQICQMLNAQIYATVGSEEKVQYLVEHYGLSPERIFNSRNTTFLDDVMRVTGNRGVDIVLNSLSGELLDASWRCVAKYGKMVELGKRDLIGNGRLGLEPFLHNRSFFGVDLAEVAQDRPEEMQRTMNQVIKYYNEGYIQPIRRHDFQAGRISDAMRFMQGGKHIGKIVVTLSEADVEQLPAVDKTLRQTRLSSEATYLLIGGLGGLGKSAATWMVERGARNLIFMSRSAGKSQQDQAFLQQLEMQGCRAIAAAADVADLAEVQRVVMAAPTPIAGVLQLSVVLRDGPLLQTTYNDWQTVQRPKVKGTWNLHQALGDVKLDFFVLLSSLAGTFGNPGQSSYNSANTFLDSFLQYRHSLNLPCSVIDLGAMEEIGLLSRDHTTRNQLRDAGAYMLQEENLIEALQIAMGAGHRQVMVGLNSSKALSDPSNRVPWKRDIRMGLYQQLQSQDESPMSPGRDDALRNFLNSAAADPDMLDDAASLELVSREIGRTLCGFMLLPEEDLDVKASLSSMGLDSLVGIEIRNWYTRTLGVEISVLEIVSSATVEQLGRKAVAALKQKHGSEKYLVNRAP